eukprot:CAMPEP_0197454906 /NCGR_PEP_ID=MMETSP1175-20131217/39336_1 /TAXON_ID=1003142 /ORGANISM="Triceratium dubium, Strain CCMP147" /LENGTH=34 /DNA_ID= /DNA_START= /DNA_END= /DNA_ORIENTATION=
MRIVGSSCAAMSLFLAGAALRRSAAGAAASAAFV